MTTIAKVPREGPAWVDAFLSGDYFTSCNFHTGGKNERNQFCTECPAAGPLCQFGLLGSHAGHRTLQIRKASHMDSIRVVDIQKCLEVADIQTYSINSAKIVFLLSRPQPRPSKGAIHACRCCNRPLSDDVEFCSLACKLDVLREQPDDGSITFALPVEDCDGKDKDGEIEGVQDRDQQQQQETLEQCSSAEQQSPQEHDEHEHEHQVQKQAKIKKRLTRKKWSEKRGIRKKQPSALLLPKICNKLLPQENGFGTGSKRNNEQWNESPSTPEKFESCSSSKPRCRKGVPRRAPMG